jgi:hypothetical protein
MAPAVVQATAVTDVTGVGTFTAAFGSNVGAGNTMFFIFCFDANDLSPNTAPPATNITDTRGNSYSQIFLENASGTNLAGIVVYAADNPNAGANTISFNNATGANTGARGGCCGIECSGLSSAATMLDQHGFTLATSGTSVTSPSLTTTAASELLMAIGYGLGAGSFTFTVGSGYTIDTQGNCHVAGAMAEESKVVSSIGSYTASISGITNGSFIQIALLTLKAATYSISGNAGVAGATVAYSGAASGHVTADGSGNYTISGLGNGTYNITPAKTNYLFTQVIHSVTVSGANVTGINFTAAVGSPLLISTINGIHQNSNLTSGGGTDDTTLIQAVLDAYGVASTLTIVQDGVSLISGLNLWSNQTFQCSNINCGFYLANSSNREMLRNANRTNSTIVDTGITVNGGYWNGNKSNQSGTSQADNTPMAGFGFYGISNITIENLTIYNASAWAIGIGNFSNARVNNCSLLASTAVSNLVTDGIDLRGPGTTASLTNLTILSGDDAISLNARNYSSSVVGPYITGGGAISGVTINNITLNSSCFSGLDLITDDTFGISNVSASNISGQVQNYAFYCNRDTFDAPIPTTGSWTTIRLTNCSVTQSGTPFGAGIPAGLYLVDGATTSLTLTNISPSPALLSLPTTHGAITGLTSEGVSRGNFSGVNTTINIAGLTYVQSRTTQGSSSAAIGLAYSSNTTAGSLLLVWSLSFNGAGAKAFAATPVTDTLGNTWHGPICTYSDANRTYGLFWANNAGSGANTVTVHYAASVDTLVSGIMEYTGQETSNPIDQAPASVFSATGTTATCPTVTTTRGNETIIGFGAASTSSGNAAGTGFSARTINDSTHIGTMIDQGQLPIATTTPTWTQSNGAYLASTVSLRSSASNTISGSTGVPNCKVTYFDTINLTSGVVTADGSGNYTITNLAASTWNVAPYDTAHSFNPGVAQIVLTTDATQNFTPTAVAAPRFSYTQIGADTFHRADENPLNPAVWQTFGGYPNLQIVSNECEGTALSMFNAEQFIATWPTNVYGQFQLDAAPSDGTSSAAIDFREDSPGNNAFTGSVARNTDGSFQVTLGDLASATQGLYIYSIPASLGDVFRFELFGATGYFYKNGTLIAVCNLNNASSYGAFGDLAVNCFTASLGDLQVSNFAFGSMVALAPVGGSELDFGMDFTF